MYLFRLSISVIVLALSASYALASSQQPLTLPSPNPPFDPHSYPKSVAHCSAINRETSKPTNIDIQYVEVNPTASRTLLLVHGWPGLWSTWSNQIQHFEKDYHLIVPNLRGFGASTHPGDVQSSGTMADMVSDLACVLQHANVQHKVVCVGHDWGSQICHQAARIRPDLVEAVAGAALPYLPSAGPFLQVEELSAVVPHLSYNVYLEKHTGEAAAELDTSLRRTLRAIFRSSASPPPADFLTSTTSFLGAWKDYEIPAIPFMTEAEEEYLVEQYSIQGFEKTLQFYTYGNRLGSWSFDRAQGNFSISQPALSILPTNDPVADWEFISKVAQSAAFLPQLTTKTMYAQHWPQLEEPEVYNNILQDWLNTLPPL